MIDILDDRKKLTADFVIIGNEKGTGHKYSSNIYFVSYQVCVFDSSYFQLCQSDANSEKKQSQADHTVGSYHQRNKHWPVSLNNNDENGDDDNYHDDIHYVDEEEEEKDSGSMRSMNI